MYQRVFKNIIELIFVFIVVIGCKEKEVVKEESKKKPNILFIAVDDLRPELGCYGSEIAITPNLDALAADGLLFENAYCQQAICSPSRASIMTGARPETINVIENYTYFRDVNPDIVTLSQHFIANGYEAAASGKIYHNEEFGDRDLSWSRDLAKLDYKRPKRQGGYVLPENQEMYRENKADMIAKYGADAAKRGLGKGPAYEFADEPDSSYEDGYATDLAIATMKEMAKEDKPFFLGLGMKKPHLDWVAPKKYWDMYNPDAIKLATQTEGPEGGAEMGLHPSFELRVRSGIPKKGPIDDELALNLKRAYLACVSYVDAQIGRMIDAIDEAGLRENTIIIVWSDHGWHLGDMGIWGKATNYEIATRVPMMIWTPNMLEKNRGKVTNALVELVDIYPSLCDLAGIDIPTHVEGESFVPLLTKPNKKWKKAAFSQFPSPALREWGSYPIRPSMRETYFGPLLEEVEEEIILQQKDKWERDLYENYLMGSAMRTEKYRFVVWKDMRDLNSDPVFIELYNHKTDPKETLNIADKNPKLVKKLLTQFNKGWKGNGAKIQRYKHEKKRFF